MEIFDEDDDVITEDDYLNQTSIKGGINVDSLASRETETWRSQHFYMIFVIGLSPAYQKVRKNVSYCFYPAYHLMQPYTQKLFFIFEAKT
jgi:hypothetical protein